jgi:GNAT superfamily N-acetyltransferase
MVPTKLSARSMKCEMGLMPVRLRRIGMILRKSGKESDSMDDEREIPSPIGMLRLRPERLEDRDFCYRLFCESRPPQFAVLAPAAVRQVMTYQFHGQNLNHLARFPQASVDIIELSGEPIGRLVVDRSAAVLHLVDLAIVPQWRGRGGGTAIMRVLMDEARAAEVPVRLEIAAPDDPSVRLYLRLGFMPIETAPFYTRLEWQPAPR